jgi:hypothetical protein
MDVGFGRVTLGNGIDSKVALLLIPVFLVQIGLIITALVDLTKRKKFKYGNKLMWLLVILFVSIIGPIVYIIFKGSEE